MKKAIAAVLGVVLPCMAWGQESPPTELRPYLGLGLSSTAADSERHSDDGFGGYAGFGYPFHRNFALDGYLTYSEFSGTEDWKEYGAELNGLLTFPLNGGWVPYLSLGMGIAQNDLEGAGRSVDLAYQAGSGVIFMWKALGEKWGLQADAKYRLIDINDSVGGGSVAADGGTIGDVVVKLGLILLLGEKPVEPSAPVGSPPPPAAPSDSDGDGVPDGKDRCPDTPQGTKVDEFGCPLAAQIDSPVRGAKFGPIYFDFDKSDIRASEVAKLDQAIAAYKKQSNTRVVLKADGHTDSVGTPGYNDGLSERRANAVKSYLVKRGIPAEHIEIVAYGESKPATTNDTPEGRAMNRRVELTLMSSE